MGEPGVVLSPASAASGEGGAGRALHSPADPADSDGSESIQNLVNRPLSPSARPRRALQSSAASLIVLSAQSVAVTLDGLTLRGADSAPALVTSAATLSILRCTFTNNTGGGAVRIEGGAVHVADASFVSNSAPRSNGGGAAVLAGRVIIERTRFVNNRAVSGGAIYVQGNASSVELVGATISDNVASSAGGAVSPASTWA